MPVALREVRFAVPLFRVVIFARFVFVVEAFVVDAFRVLKFAVVPKRVAMFPVIAFRIEVAKLPVTVRLVAVVEAIVEEPDTVRLVKKPVANEAILPSMFVTVVEARVVEPAERFVVERFV